MKDNSRKQKQQQSALHPNLLFGTRESEWSMQHADFVLCKGIEDEFLLQTTTKWILELGYPEATIRTDGESSIVALSRRVEEELTEASVRTMHNTSPAYNSRSAGYAEWCQNCVTKGSHVGMLWKKIHGGTVGTSHVWLLWCVRLANQKWVDPTVEPTEWQAIAEPTVVRECHVDFWFGLKKVSYLEPSKRTVHFELKWIEGIYLGIKDESEIVVARHTELFFFFFLREASAEFQNRILSMVCCSAASKFPWELHNLELREKSWTECSWMTGLNPHWRQRENSCQE